MIREKVKKYKSVAEQHSLGIVVAVVCSPDSGIDLESVIAALIGSEGLAMRTAVHPTKGETVIVDERPVRTGDGYLIRGESSQYLSGVLVMEIEGLHTIVNYLQNPHARVVVAFPGLLLGGSAGDSVASRE